VLPGAEGAGIGLGLLRARVVCRFGGTFWKAFLLISIT
jgi:hypothetical protein